MGDANAIRVVLPLKEIRKQLDQLYTNAAIYRGCYAIIRLKNKAGRINVEQEENLQRLKFLLEVTWQLINLRLNI